MARSMTGFGGARRITGTTEIRAEIRSVNSKTCDVKVRLPRDLTHVEQRIHAAVRARVHRGRVDVSVELVDTPDAIHVPRVNLSLARGYAKAYAQLSEALDLPTGPPSLGLLWSAPGVIEAPTLDLGPAVEAAIEAAIATALDALEATRAEEGRHLIAELSRLTDEFAALVSAIVAEVPRTLAQRRSRLEARLRELVGEVGVDPVRLAQEVAILADRADISEELARLDSHLVQLRGLLARDEPIGRRLEFVLQEVHRETNTLGSKAASAEIAHAAVEAKSVLERLKEQVQNVE